jgi:hypothetical protein
MTEEEADEAGTPDALDGDAPIPLSYSPNGIYSNHGKDKGLFG